uniref:Nucleotide-diphospho-sugar transferase domain-containing protein n=1 Tax=Alexandrium monilatum TaxID=311494 RepID=A0A7S4SGG4_9DINO
MAQAILSHEDIAVPGHAPMLFHPPRLVFAAYISLHVFGEAALECALQAGGSQSLGLLQKDARTGATELGEVGLEESDRDLRPPGPGPHVGVLLGYDQPDRVKPGSFGAVSLRLARHWADLHNYSLFVEPNLGRLSAVPEAPVWDKIAAVRQYLPKVDVLLWMDLDVLIVDPARRVSELLRRDRQSCARTGQAEDDSVLASKGDDIFLWAATAEFAHLDSGAYEHREPDFKLNLCAGAFALRNDPRSFEFLEAVWRQRHSQNWPAEQGAMWRVLLERPEMLARTCVLPEGVFVYESLESPGRALGRPGPFAIHATGFKGLGADKRRNEISRAVCNAVFSAKGGCPEPQPPEM